MSEPLVVYVIRDLEGIRAIYATREAAEADLANFYADPRGERAEVVEIQPRTTPIYDDIRRAREAREAAEILAFEAAHGRPPESQEELEAWEDGHSVAEFEALIRRLGEE